MRSQLSTGFDQRDAHLRSADFFDAENHPWIVARTTGFEGRGAGYLVHLDVTIRGVTRPVTLEGEFLGIVPGMHGGRHAGFHLSGTIDREAWGLTWNVGLEAGGWLVGRQVSSTSTWRRTASPPRRRWPPRPRPDSARSRHGRPATRSGPSQDAFAVREQVA